jgi:hypothetical protein
VLAKSGQVCLWWGASAKIVEEEKGEASRRSLPKHCRQFHPIREICPTSSCSMNGWTLAKIHILTVLGVLWLWFLFQAACQNRNLTIHCVNSQKSCEVRSVSFSWHPGPVSCQGAGHKGLANPKVSFSPTCQVEKYHSELQEKAVEFYKFLEQEFPPETGLPFPQSEVTI